MLSSRGSETTDTFALPLQSLSQLLKVLTLETGDTGIDLYDGIKSDYISDCRNQRSQDFVVLTGRERYTVNCLHMLVQIVFNAQNAALRLMLVLDG